jgi:hypothetical protein
VTIWELPRYGGLDTVGGGGGVASGATAPGGRVQRTAAPILKKKKFRATILGHLRKISKVPSVRPHGTTRFALGVGDFYEH